MKKNLMIALSVLAVAMMCCCKSATEKKSVEANTTDDTSHFVTLTDVVPDVILEKYAPKDGAERDSKYVFIKSFAGC